MAKHSTVASAPPRPRKVAPARRKPQSFPIVGIGASAGGLDAFKRFFGAMPADAGVAFVLIQHLDPTRESLTADLVGTYTKMRVVQATDGMPVERNRVYVIPPNAYLSLGRQRLPKNRPTLRVSAPTAPRSLRMAVDFFFHSLATEQREDAIGIILSGTGSDGTLGLKDIKAYGGMSMVQDPQTAQHDGMPNSAIRDGSADYILPPEKMAATLVEYVRHSAVAVRRHRVPAQAVADPLLAVVEVLRAHTRFDFSGYKTGTLRRRIERRMSLRHFRDLPAYVALLRKDPAEVTALFKDLLIHVTSFFREPAAWQVLQEQVVRRLVAGKETGATLRVWIPACATGEEAYSLAMVLIEEIQAAGKNHRLQVFASDIDADTLEVARTGLYPEGIAAHVSPERLARFFLKGEHGYQVTKELRDSVVFAQQSLLSDPPFSRIDVISCRNLFIYLEASVQERLMPLLHFSLLPGGYLFLGSAEGVGLQAELFEAVSTKWRIFRRVGPTRHDRLQLPVAATPIAPVAREQRTIIRAAPRLATLAQHLLLQRYAPTCVIINRAKEILYFQGRTDDYLTQPSGVPTQDLIAQARHGLRAQLRSAVQEAMCDNERVVLPDVQVRRGNTFHPVKITVEPLKSENAEIDGLWLVSLEEGPHTGIAATPTKAPVAVPDDAALVRQLEYELKSTKEDLQQTIEDVKATNEELMSVNEEFQSSNEELETSKEELQSLNEELTTANVQLESKIGELEATNNDLDNLLTSTNIATLFLDTQMRIRRFTPSATRLFSLIATDVGRPIGDIAQKFSDPRLLLDAAAVLHDPVAPKTEVQAHDGRWYVRQVLPYRTRDHRTEGVVMTFSDVAAEALHEARLYAEAIVDTVREPLLVLDADLRVCSANRAFYSTFHVSQEETVGQLLYDLGRREWDLPHLRTQLGDVLPQKLALNDLELTADFQPEGSRTMLLNARAIDRGDSRPHLILLAIEDITERKQAQEALQKSRDLKRFEEQVRQRQSEVSHAQRVSTVGELASGLAHELNQPLSAIANGVEACARYVRADKIDSKKLLTLLDEASGEALRAGSIVEHLRHFIEKGKPQFERADLGEIAHHVPLLFTHALEKAAITLDLQIPPQPLFIYADAIQIEQIMVNLMQNAIDAIREAPATLMHRREIQLEVWSEKGLAEVAVRDSGSGVPTAVNERMFEPFFTTKVQGLGMGLAISRSIIEAHRGRIWIKPRIDGTQGTTVRFSLPLLPPSRLARKKGTGAIA